MSIAGKSFAFFGSVKAAILGSTILTAGLVAPALAQQSADTPDEYRSEDVV